MTSPTHSRPRQPRKLGRRQVAAFLALGVLAGGAGAATNAAFTDTGFASATAATGTLDITLNGGQHETSGAALNLSALGGTFEPGTTKTQAVTLRNAGTIDSKVAITPQGLAAPLSTNLNIKVSAGGSVLYNGVLSNLSAVTTLGGGASAALSIELSAPTSMPNTLQGKSTPIILVFNASQASL